LTDRGTTSLAAIVLCAWLGAGIAAGQSGPASVSGTVLDPAGRLVAGARIRLDSASGARLTGTSLPSGEFTIGLPAWGIYTVRVEADGLPRRSGRSI